MKELVLLKNDEAFTNSLIIAEGAGIEHRALIQLIILSILSLQIKRPESLQEIMQPLIS